MRRRATSEARKRAGSSKSDAMAAVLYMVLEDEMGAAGWAVAVWRSELHLTAGCRSETLGLWQVPYLEFLCKDRQGLSRRPSPRPSYIGRSR